MDKLNNLTSTLNEIHGIAKKIIKKALPIMEELSEDDNDLIDDLSELIEATATTEESVTVETTEGNEENGDDEESGDDETEATEEDDETDTNIDLNSLLRDTVTSLIGDAETVINEIESFTDVVTEGDEAIEENETKYPFFIQVWFGDIYDKSHIKGLQSLILSTSFCCHI